MIVGLVVTQKVICECSHSLMIAKLSRNFFAEFFFESAFVVNSTNPMVLCERSFVAVAHTYTPHRTARPPTAPPRRERDEGMGQQRRKHKHVWEGSVMRHAARRFSLSGTAPPL